MQSIYFQETQKMRQIWIWVLLFATFGLWMWAFVQQVVLGQPFGNRPASDTGLVLIGLVVFVPLILITRIKLITEVRQDGIYYRMTFFMPRFKHILPSQIKSFEVRPYKPVSEYGGWGYRTAFNKKKGSALSMSGKTGLQIELTNGKKLLLGTQKPEEFITAVKKIMPVLKP